MDSQIGAPPQVDGKPGLCNTGRVGTRTWPDDWEDRRAGIGCRGCTAWPDEDQHGVRYLSTDHADAYLQCLSPAPGYSIVVFRGRHVSDPSELDDRETLAFWSAVRIAARAIESVFDPCHLNYQLLGNEMPHVHVHIVPRFPDDPSPGRPLAAASWDNAVELTPEALAEQVAALTGAVRN